MKISKFRLYSNRRIKDMEEKVIYQFSVDKEVETIKKTERKKRGSDEKVITEKKVKENVPVEIQIRRPNRRQLEEAEFEYSIEMSRCIKKGILTKAMLAKKYSDTGGAFSEDAATRYGELCGEVIDLQNEFTRLDIADKKNEKQKARLEEVKETLGNVRRDLVEIESSFQSLFNHTADAKAQEKLLLWYTLHLTYVLDEEKDEFVQYFEGKTFEEKQEDFYKKEESADEFYFKLAQRVSTVFAFWFFNQASSPDDFSELMEKVDKGEL